MVEPSALHTATLARLKTLTTLAVYDGDVPPSPPADSQGRVYPYAVLWPASGVAPLEQAVDAVAVGTDWMCQVTVAAGDPSWVLPAVQKVRQVLAGWSPAEGAVLTEETPRSVTVLRDDDVTPKRWFMPLQFGCLTP